MGSGWSNAYRFYSDGRFVWHESQMARPTREPRRDGTWRVEGRRLVLTTTKRTVLVGGKLVFDPPLEQGQFVGARAVIRTIDPPQRSIHDIGQPTKAESGHLRLTIGKTTWWKHRDNPKDYD